MGKQLHETPPPPRVRAPQRPIPRAVEAVVVRAMAKSPPQRFAVGARDARGARGDARGARRREGDDARRADRGRGPDGRRARRRGDRLGALGARAHAGRSRGVDGRGRRRRRRRCPIRAAASPSRRSVDAVDRASPTTVRRPTAAPAGVVPFAARGARRGARAPEQPARPRRVGARRAPGRRAPRGAPRGERLGSCATARSSRAWSWPRCSTRAGGAPRPPPCSREWLESHPDAADARAALSTSLR